MTMKTCGVENKNSEGGEGWNKLVDSDFDTKQRDKDGEGKRWVEYRSSGI